MLPSNVSSTNAFSALLFSNKRSNDHDLKSMVQICSIPQVSHWDEVALAPLLRAIPSSPTTRLATALLPVPELTPKQHDLHDSDTRIFSSREFVVAPLPNLSLSSSKFSQYLVVATHHILSVPYSCIHPIATAHSLFVVYLLLHRSHTHSLSHTPLQCCYPLTPSCL